MKAGTYIQLTNKQQEKRFHDFGGSWLPILFEYCIEDLLSLKPKYTDTDIPTK